MLTLILGGARSGKSELAERLAAKADPPVTYVAAGGLRTGDPAWADRVSRHQQRRPPHWFTVEVAPGGDLMGAVGGKAGTVIVDAIGPWLAGVADFEADLGALGSALGGREGDTFVVSDEVGMGVHPSSEAGMAFRDALGSLNTHLASLAERAYLVVAGRVVRLGDSLSSYGPEFTDPARSDGGGK